MASMIVEEILRAIGDRQLSVRSLDPERAIAIRRRVCDHHGWDQASWPLWETNRFPTSVQDSDAWKVIGGFVGERKCLLFLNPEDGSEVFEIDSGATLTALLGETSGFELYVTDEGAGYLICFNHHDVLLGAGDATDWILRTFPAARHRGGGDGGG